MLDSHTGKNNMKNHIIVTLPDGNIFALFSEKMRKFVGSVGSLDDTLVVFSESATDPYGIKFESMPITESDEFIASLKQLSKIVVYDNNGLTADRYTVFPYAKSRDDELRGMCLDMSPATGHPLDVSMWGWLSKEDRHELSKNPDFDRISFADLDDMTREHVIQAAFIDKE